MALFLDKIPKKPFAKLYFNVEDPSGEVKYFFILQKDCYKSLKTGAETGWDFSSRWFFDDSGGTETNLTRIRAQRVVPVDLNVFLCRAFSLLAEFYSLLSKTDKQIKWQERSDIWQKSIQMVKNIRPNTQKRINFEKCV